MGKDERERCADRLEMALEMFEFGLEIKKQQFRRNQPGLSEAEIDTLVERWLVDQPIGAGVEAA